MRVRHLCALALSAALIPLAAPGVAGATGYSDAFFRPAPTGEPGDVINARKEFLPHFPGSDVDQLVFRSTNSHGEPTTGAATLIRPPGMRPDAPIFTYDHFINSLAADCQPSAAFRNPNPEAQLVGASMTITNLALARGWAVLLPDHEGPNAAYGANIQGGHITLDAIRAATDAKYRTEHSPATAVGYSGGSGAAYFAASEQPNYAPDVNLVGAAMGGLPADYAEMIEFGFRGSGPHPGAAVAAISAVGLSREYPEIELDNKLNDGGREFARSIEGACTQSLLGAGGTIGNLKQVSDLPKDVLLNDPAVRGVMERESPVNAPVPQVPLHFWQSPNDGLMPYEPVRRLAGQACAAGTPTDFSEAARADHITNAVAGIPAVIDWAGGRFAGQPAPSNCGASNSPWGS